MDAYQFGAFIAKRRRKLHMTQSDLAAKIHVTDKAVSRWERGLGFPDIKTIEPLADALEASIVEIMKSEEIVNQEVSVEAASTALSDSLELAAEQRQREQKSIWLIIGIAAVISSVVQFLDTISWNKAELSLQAKIPWSVLGLSAALLIGGILRKIQGKTCAQMICTAFIVLLIPLVLCGISFWVMALLA